MTSCCPSHVSVEDEALLANSTQAVLNATEKLVAKIHGMAMQADLEFRENLMRVRNVLVPLIVLVGLVGNTLSLLVFTRGRLQQQVKSSIYLAALAVTDIAFLCTLFPSWLNDVRPLVWSETSCKLLVFVSYCSSFMSPWCTICFTLERYVAICHPLRAKIIFAKVNGKAVVGGLLVVSLCMYALSLWSTVAYQAGDVTVCTTDMKYMEELRVITWLDTVVTMVLPFLLLTIMNTRISVEVWRFYRRKRTMMAHQMNWSTVERTSQPESPLVSRKFFKKPKRKFHRQSSWPFLRMFSVASLEDTFVQHSPTAVKGQAELKFGTTQLDGCLGASETVNEEGKPAVFEAVIENHQAMKDEESNGYDRVNEDESLAMAKGSKPILEQNGLADVYQCTDDVTENEDKEEDVHYEEKEVEEQEEQICKTLLEGNRLKSDPTGPQEEEEYKEEETVKAHNESSGSGQLRDDSLRAKVKVEISLKGDPYAGDSQMLSCDEVLSPTSADLSFTLIASVSAEYKTRARCAKRKKRRRKKQDGNNRQPCLALRTHVQLRTTFTLLIVSTSFLVLNLPSHALRLRQLLDVSGQGRLPSLHERLVHEVARLAYYATFALNFFLYTMYGRHLRLALKDLVKRYCRKLCTRCARER